ncbi:uncharacterized protein LY79DRAFT_47030 [Colletotrichum navitas]|uniref:Uncharacterized protein n=1 Tax=Colletotrichum navitas TaxID=681940 RepID=A0AAD8PMR7_9PEZI|nr:uncharacterized protein LY79DRAFT_47030 [Colletotrichum navitas]KAK1570204.1 hypothetical protein LY79DRAFT_47030 [Colletotrichum navitas]
MCLNNSSLKLCGDSISYYASKPKKQRGFRWCVRTRATILFQLYCRRHLPSDADQNPFKNELIPCLRVKCNILAHEPAWAFVVPYFDSLVRHYATKWVTEARNGSLVTWCQVSGWQWDENKTSGWVGVDAVEAWMRRELRKTDWWQRGRAHDKRLGLLV